MKKRRVQLAPLLAEGLFGAAIRISKAFKKVCNSTFRLRFKVRRINKDKVAKSNLRLRVNALGLKL